MRDELVIVVYMPVRGKQVDETVCTLMGTGVYSGLFVLMLMPIQVLKGHRTRPMRVQFNATEYALFCLMLNIYSTGTAEKERKNRANPSYEDKVLPHRDNS